MERSMMGDESCARHEDQLSSTILVGSENHHRTDLKISPILGALSPQFQRPPLRQRNAGVPKQSRNGSLWDETGHAGASTSDYKHCFLDESSSGYRSHESTSQREHSSEDQQQLQEGERDMDAAFCDEEKAGKSNSSEYSVHVENSEFASTSQCTGNLTRASNPFESTCLESLAHSVLSPGVFSNFSCHSESPASGSFKWSIDHMAILQPADITEEEIVRSRIQLNDPEFEGRAQAAIDTFWNSDSFHYPSPDLRQPLKKSLLNSVQRVMAGTPGSSKSSSLGSTCSAKRRPPNSTRVFPFGAMPISASSPISLAASPLTRPALARRSAMSRKLWTRSSQTAVTIPPSADIDLLALLGPSFAYDQDMSGVVEEVMADGDRNETSFSLRRRLFLDDEECDEHETSAMQGDAQDILTPLLAGGPYSTDSPSMATPRMRADLGVSASPASRDPRLERLMPIPFPDFSPIQRSE